MRPHEATGYKNMSETICSQTIKILSQSFEHSPTKTFSFTLLIKHYLEADLSATTLHKSTASGLVSTFEVKIDWSEFEL